MLLTLSFNRVIQFSPNNELYQYVASTYMVGEFFNFYWMI